MAEENHGTVRADARRRRRRRAVRVLVLDEQDRVLLFLDSDRSIDARWWMTPGGGIDEGESDGQAAIRELFEETGLVVSATDLLGPIATREVIHGYSDHITDQQEAFYLVRTPQFEIDVTGHSADEKLTVLDHRWWSVAELRATAEVVWPRTLVDLLEAAGRPDAWPTQLATTEESSVPVPQ